MKKEDAVLFHEKIDKAEALRSLILLTITHEGQVNIAVNGPPGVQDFVFLEKALSNWLSDVMAGRVQDHRFTSSL